MEKSWKLISVTRNSSSLASFVVRRTMSKSNVRNIGGKLMMTRQNHMVDGFKKMS